MNLKRFTNRNTLLTVLLVVGMLLLVVADPALAGPGGLVKQASKTFWGKLVMVGLVLFFLPLIVVHIFKRRRLVKKTRRALREISRQAPHFEWMRLKGRITDIFLWVHEAWDQRKMEMAQEFMTPWYCQNQQLILDRWERDGVENIVSDVTIKEITPIYVACDPHDEQNDRIVVEIDAEMRDYLVDRSGKVVTGDKKLDTVSRIWSFTRENGQWVLAMIEDEQMVWAYLKEEDVVPDGWMEQAR